MAVSDGAVIKTVLEIVLADGTIAQNVFRLVVDADGQVGNSVITAACKLYIENIYDEVDQYLHDGFSINSTMVQEEEFNAVTDIWEIVQDLGMILPAFAHANTDDPFPNQMAATISAPTYKPKTRGRKFLIGFVETAAMGGDLITAAVTALTAAAAEYVLAQNIGGSDTLTPTVHADDDGTVWNLAYGIANSIMGTQRRRKPGVGA